MPTAASQTLQITNYKSPITRIVSLQPSATSTLARLGALDSVVACTRYCRDVCPEVQQRVDRGLCALVADSWTAQAAQIKAANPDLVIASVPYQLEAVAEILKAGIRFLGLAPHTLTDIYADIALIAGAVGLPSSGAELITTMQSAIEVVRARTAEANSRPRVFCEEWGKPIIVSQHWIRELVSAAGGEFVGEPGAKPDPQSVASLAPDVLIAAWCGAGDRVPLAKIIEQRGWRDLAAVRARRVFCIRDELLNTPGPALIEGLHALAAAIHPEIFGETAHGLRKLV